MKRKSLVIALLAGMMLSLTACGVTAKSASTKDAGREEAAEENDPEPEDTETESEDIEKEPEDTVDEPETNTTEDENITDDEEAVEEEDAEDEEEEEEASSGRYKRGNVTDTSFESEWIGFRYDLPEDFTMASQEEMDAVLQIGSEMIYEENADMIADYSKMVMVYEMMAMDSLNDTVTVCVERTSLNPEEYAEALEAQIALVDGVEIKLIDEEKDAQIGGVEFYKYSYELNYSGVTIYQDYYMAERNGRMIEILLAYADESVRDVMLDGFAPY